METKVISELTELATVDKSNDWVPVVDVSDTTESVEGTTKKAVVNQFIGPTGAAATVDVGTTTTSAPGTDASVVNSGSTSAAVFDFTIPRGATGATGAQGNPGVDGANAYCYIAYASDASGTGFTMTFNANLDYIAILSTDTEITNPQASDFAGLWKNYKGTTGNTGSAGADGDDAYVYIAYASDINGSDFTMTFDTNLDYIAILNTTTAIPSPIVTDFAGLWKNYKGLTGDQGIQGNQGDPGLAATITVGTTTTLDAGNPATVENVGDSTDAIFNFGIPKGADGTNGTNGTNGTDGLDITWLGAYVAETTYAINDAVSYLGSSYICKLESTGNLPTNATYWDVMAAKGTDGEGAGDVTGPTTNTDSYIPQWDGANSKTLKDGLAVPAGGLAGLTALGEKLAKTTDVTAINDTGIADGEVAIFNKTNKDIRTSDKTIVTTIGVDDSTIPTSKAVNDAIAGFTSYTDEQAQDAVGTILTDSSEIDFTYNDETPSITASLKNGSIDETKLDTSTNASLDLADSALQGITTSAPTNLTGFLKGNGTNVLASTTAVVAGTCTTARTTAEKVCNISGYTLTAGDMLAITFTDGFSVNNATLNINSGGAVNIRVGAVNVTTALISVAAATSFTLPLYYDGTYFYAYGSGLNTNTTYTEISEAEITAGTASTARTISGRRAEFLAASIKDRTETLTNKTLTSPVINTSISGTAILDEDNMASDSATKLATQQSIKAYVDAKGFTWKGAWATSTAYVVNDSVQENGSGYICLTAHTSGTFATDLAAGKWSLFVEGVGGNSIQVDSSGGTSDTYGTLSGLVNSSNKVYTVSLGSYVSGSLRVYLNGQLQTQGSAEDWTETTPASGTFTFNTAPSTGDIIIVMYQFSSGATGNADTVDNLHASSFAPESEWNDGWIAVSDTWTYASATTITVPSGATSLYQKGDKIKLTQTTVKYFYIVGVADTVLTVTGGSDYTVANAPISAISYSHTENPLGFPEWFVYTISITGFSANPNMLGRFSLRGTTCYTSFVSTSNGTSNATSYTISLPITARTVTNFVWRGSILGVDNGAYANNSTYAIASAGTTASLYINGVGTWTNSGNKSANGQMVYEI